MIKKGNKYFPFNRVARTGFEPVIFALRGRCPKPLDERAVIYRYNHILNLVNKFKLPPTKLKVNCGRWQFIPSGTRLKVVRNKIPEI